LDEKNAKTAREYLEMSRDLVHNSNNIFEELDSIRLMIQWAKNHNYQDEKNKWEANLKDLIKVLSIQGK